MISELLIGVQDSIYRQPGLTLVLTSHQSIRYTPAQEPILRIKASPVRLKIWSSHHIFNSTAARIVAVTLVNTIKRDTTVNVITAFNP